jgi:rhodanese-related sulfurtransferase
MPTRVDALEARRMIDAEVTLLDVLPAAVFAEEHLPRARNVPLETFRPDDVADLDRDAALVVYCFDQH